MVPEDYPGGHEALALGSNQIETPAMEGLDQHQRRVQQFKDNFAAAVPLGRVGQPDESLG